MRLVLFLLGTFAATAFASESNAATDAATQRLLQCVSSSVNQNNGQTVAIDCKDQWVNALISEASAKENQSAVKEAFYGSGGAG